MRKDLILDPEHLADVPVHQLLEAASHGYIAVDHRWLHAIVDRPADAIPDLVRFAAEDHEKDRFDVEEVLVDIFRYLRTPTAVPFLVDLVGRDPDAVSDELIESIVDIGEPAVDPLLALWEELEGQDSGDLPFIVASMRVRDPRILDLMMRRLSIDPIDAALSLEIYGDPAAIPALEAALQQLPADFKHRDVIPSAIKALASHTDVEPHAPEPFDIWDRYEQEDSPHFDALTDAERLAMLDSSSPKLRAEAAASYSGSEPADRVRARLLELAKKDPAASVRGAAWEGLSQSSSEPELRRAMLDVLLNADASIEEKSGAVLALAHQTDNPVVYNAILELYADPRARAKALKAMGPSLDRRFAEFPPRHLDDPDPEIKRQAIWGVGYLQLSSEAPRLEVFFDDQKLRTDSLFAYALSVPGDTSRARIRSVLDKIRKVADGLSESEEEVVQIALDQRLMLHGHKPVFFADDEDESEPAVSTKVARNDPCPCGTGNKYKKCCGA